jgi:hypothetical protein
LASLRGSQKVESAPHVVCKRVIFSVFAASHLCISLRPIESLHRGSSKRSKSSSESSRSGDGGGGGAASATCAEGLGSYLFLGKPAASRPSSRRGATASFLEGLLNCLLAIPSGGVLFRNCCGPRSAGWRRPPPKRSARGPHGHFHHYIARGWLRAAMSARRWDDDDDDHYRPAYKGTRNYEVRLPPFPNVPRKTLMPRP